MKVENMRVQHGQVVESIHEHDNHAHGTGVDYQPVKDERSKYGIIAVCFGDGIKLGI